MVENKDKDPVERALEVAKPLAAQLSFGAVMGYCSGTAMKKIGKAVAFGVGCLFIGLQAAVSTGYIAVDWAKISDDTMKKLDTVSADYSFMWTVSTIICCLFAFNSFCGDPV